MNAMRQTGVGNGSILNFTPVDFRCAMAASKSSTSNPTEQPVAVGCQSGAPAPRDKKPEKSACLVKRIPDSR